MILLVSICVLLVGGIAIVGTKKTQVEPEKEAKEDAHISQQSSKYDSLTNEQKIAIYKEIVVAANDAITKEIEQGTFQNETVSENDVDFWKRLEEEAIKFVQKKHGFTDEEFTLLAEETRKGGWHLLALVPSKEMLVNQAKVLYEKGDDESIVVAIIQLETLAAAGMLEAETVLKDIQSNLTTEQRELIQQTKEELENSMQELFIQLQNKKQNKNSTK